MAVVQFPEFSGIAAISKDDRRGKSRKHKG
jgi:hypothetical protein